MYDIFILAKNLDEIKCLKELFEPTPFSNSPTNSKSAIKSPSLIS